MEQNILRFSFEMGEGIEPKTYLIQEYSDFCQEIFYVGSRIEILWNKIFCFESRIGGNTI